MLQSIIDRAKLLAPKFCPPLKLCTRILPPLHFRAPKSLPPPNWANPPPTHKFWPLPYDSSVKSCHFDTLVTCYQCIYFVQNLHFGRFNWALSQTFFKNQNSQTKCCYLAECLRVPAPLTILFQTILSCDRIILNRHFILQCTIPNPCIPLEGYAPEQIYMVLVCYGVCWWP